MPVLNIKDPEAHAMAVEIAQRTGQSLTQVVKEALQERLARDRMARSDKERLMARVRELAKRASSRPVLDPRTPDEIIGYDEIGVPR